MTMATSHSRLTVTLESPFLIPAAGLDRTSLDALQARNADGKPMIPGTLVRGLFSDALRTIAQTVISPVTIPGLEGPRQVGDDWDRLFGRASGEGRRSAGQAQTPGSQATTKATIDDWKQANRPQPSGLDIGDLVAVDTPPAPTPRFGAGRYHRIRIDPEVDSVAAGAVQVVELPYPIGTPVRFEGVVRLLDRGFPAEAAHYWLDAARPIIRAIGSHKSAGFGHVLEITLAPAAEPETARVIPSLSTDRPTEIDVLLRFDRPFIVDSEKRGGNVIRSRPVVPGAVIKGALAQALRWESGADELDADLARLLTQCRFSHAFPEYSSSEARAKHGCARRILPKSVAKISNWLAQTDQEKQGKQEKEDLFGCTLLAPDPAPVATRATQDQSWLFAQDWKPGDAGKAAAQLLGQDEPLNVRFETRIRTAINYDSGTAQVFEDPEGELAGQLFAASAIVPCPTLRWVMRLTIPAVADAKPAARVLTTLAAGLPRIGSTRAAAAVTLVEAEDRAESRAPIGVQTPEGETDAWALTLATDAVLFSMDDLRKASSPHHATFAAYQAYFAEASKIVADERPGLCLHRLFASQRMVGGYLALRYPAGGDAYDPYALTEAGSVFLLTRHPDVPLDDAQSVIDRWCDNGLPVPGSYADRSWRDYVFTPTNGYGEVHANMIDHLAARLSPRLADQQTGPDRA